MGNAASGGVLSRLAGPQPLPLDDPAWQVLLGHATPLQRFDPAEVEAQVKPQVADLGERPTAVS